MTVYEIRLKGFPRPVRVNSGCYDNPCAGIYLPWFREVFSRWDWSEVRKVD